MSAPSRSWGRHPRADAACERVWHDRDAPLPAPAASAPGLLAHGMGRSYGDVALNGGGTLLRTRGLDRFIAFDAETGVLRAEAGVTLDEVLALAMPRGWFLAVTPGTRHVTLGGALANDVHGKNHHRAGSFGCHVRAFELLRSDGSRRVCTPTQEADWFGATVGGLGLTGLVTWVEIALVRIGAPWLRVRHRRFDALDGFWELDRTLGADHEHAVAWVDCLNGGRGIYSAGDFLPPDEPGPRLPPPRPGRLAVPVDPPVSLIGGPVLRAFNAAWYRRRWPPQALTHALPFFHPLDGIAHWNRLYGRRGFLQYQCVLPPEAMRDAAAELFRRIGRSGQGSFLAVFKTFGSRRSPGWLSFPRPGATLALDFPHRGDATLALLDDLDAVVAEAGGALYPAKDARMSPAMFAAGQPALERFAERVDPAFSSTFWRRVRPRR